MLPGGKGAGKPLISYGGNGLGVPRPLPVPRGLEKVKLGAI